MPNGATKAFVLLVAIAGCTPVRPSESPPASARPSDAASPEPAASRRPEAAASDPEDAVPEAWLVWTLGGLPAGVPAALQRLPQIRHVSAVASGTSWAEEWSEPGGRAHRTPGGLAMPFEIAAVDVPTYAPFVPRHVRPQLRALRPGEALVAATAAHVHGLGRGSEIVLPSGRIRVKGVVGDALAGSHELLVPAPTGRALGITTPRYLLARADDGASNREVAHAIRRAIGDAAVVRIRPPGEAAFLRHADLTLPQSLMKAFFGAFAATPAGGWLDVERAWTRRHIEEARVPILGRVECHRRVIPLIRAALHDLVRRGLGHLVDPAQYGGCYAPRFIARDPGAGLSHHAWGVAIDVNVADNPLGAEPTMDLRVVRAFERRGFVWGGRFLRPDGHHFEFRCFPERCG